MSNPTIPIIKPIEIQTIGVIESCFRDRFGTPRQSGLIKASTAKLILNKSLQPESSLQGLSDYSHLWVIFHFHLNTNLQFHPKVHPPRLGGQSIGLFATRSPHRPNPIGLSLCKIEEIRNNEIFLSGIDFVDGTPVLDIKPYLPEVEALTEAKGGWTDHLVAAPVEVRFSEQAAMDLYLWSKRYPREQIMLENLVRQTIVCDPRPNLYKGYEGEQSKYRNTHAVRLYEGDVHFQFLSATEVEVFQIKIE